MFELIGARCVRFGSCAIAPLDSKIARAKILNREIDDAVCFANFPNGLESLGRASAIAAAQITVDALGIARALRRANITYRTIAKLLAVGILATRRALIGSRLEFIAQTVVIRIARAMVPTTAHFAVAYFHPRIAIASILAIRLALCRALGAYAARAT